MSDPSPSSRPGAHPAVWVTVVALVGASFVVPYLAKSRAPELPVLGEVPASLALVDQEGRPFTRASFTGAPTVANFIFTSCPTICPTLTGKMRGLVERTGAGVRFASFSVDPETDTPAVLKAYGVTHRADFARWSFVTGPKEALESAVVDGFKVGIDRQKRDAGAGESAGGEPDVWDIVHGEHFVLVDGAGRIRGYYRAEPERMAELVRDAEALAGVR